MKRHIQLLAICGSTRATSSNLNLIQAIVGLTAGTFDITLFGGLTELPHFNPDLDQEDPPEPVMRFRHQLREADAVLICTPEYAIGVPGTLKNAVDWTVSSMDFSKKPVALITASLSGTKAHASLLGTLLILEARMTSATQVVIPFVKTKVDNTGKITDGITLQQIEELVQSLEDLITHDNATCLPAPLLANPGV